MKIKCAVVAAAVLLISAAGASAGEFQDFLKGNVQHITDEGLTLENRMATAAREFHKRGEGDTFLTGYLFPSRCGFRFHGRDRHPDPLSVTAGKEKIYIKFNWKNKESRAITGSEEAGPAGVLFLHQKKGKKDIIIDIDVIDPEKSYDFPETPLYWLGEAEADDSLDFLERIFKNSSEKMKKEMAFIFSLHDTPRCLDVMKHIAMGKHSSKVKENAVFWIGTLKDERGLDILREVYADSESSDIRKKVVFSLYNCDHQDSTKEIIRIAKTDPSLKVKKQAVFWLGQKAGNTAVEYLGEVVENEKDVELKKSAVFAISQLPEKTCVPMLIKIARTNRSPSVRKRAIFWLGQTGSTEALEFFEEILLKK